MADISHDCQAIGARHSYDIRETFLRVSHNVLMTVAQFPFHSYNSCETFVRMLSFSPESR